MHHISRIVQQKDQNRVSVYIDGKFAFGLTLESLLQNNLTVGKTLTKEEVSALKNQSDQDKVYARALRFVTSRPHSEKEIKLWFKRKKIEEALQGETLKRLEKLGLVDDLAFAKWWIEQRTVFRPKPKRVLRQELRVKGITDDIFESAFEDTETETDAQIAKKIAAKRLERLKGLPRREAKQKLLQFLAGRGFSYSAASQAIDELENDELG